MPAELHAILSTIYGFLVVLARVSGILLLVPLPGLQSTPATARVVLALALSLMLIEVWPGPDPGEISLHRLTRWFAAEFAFGLLVGASVKVLLSAVQAAGFDPKTADPGVLPVVAQFAAGVLFFALGLDRQVIRILAYRLEQLPTAGLGSNAPTAEAMLTLGSSVFFVGLRLALPVVALLALVDISFAIMGGISTNSEVR